MGNLWVQVWEQKIWQIAAFFVLLVLITLTMVFRDRLVNNKAVFHALRYGILGASFVYAGLVLKAQPTTGNIVIFFSALKEHTFPIDLFSLEPFLFLSFIFIFITIFLWGRGVFCGWLCPYGAMLELLNVLYDKVLPKYRLVIPDKVHSKLIYLKYAVFMLILGVSFYDFILSEYLTEVEPFRTFVLKLRREWYFVAYFAVLSVGSVVVYRGFCRYLCPLGAALAIPSFIRGIPVIKLRRHDFCNRCSICRRSCAPHAVMSDGVINDGECLDCMDCQLNFWDADVCPVLIKQKRQLEKSV